MSKLQIYKASAGSGKTFLLTLTFLKLALKYPDNFSKILAVTFTNKAAEEMKSRIISKVNEIIIKGSKSDYYEYFAGFLKTNNEKIIKEKAKSIQDNILHNYSIFNVSTIDKFVQKVIRSFAYEIHLNSSYEVEFDTDTVIDDLTEKLFESISENNNLQKWLSEFAEANIKEGKSWDFKKNLKELAQEIFKENFQDIYNISKHQYSKEELNKYLNDLYKIKNSFEKKMTGIAENFKSVINKAGIDYTSLGAKFKTLSLFMLKKVLIDKKYYDYGVRVSDCLEGFENWHNKSASQNVIDTLKSVYNPLKKYLEDFFDLYEKEHENYYTSIEIIKNFRSFGIINDIASLLPEYRQENNILLISDTTFLLKKIIDNNDAPFIYEKIGNRLKHILIDEFQDTSGFQWESFKPLIINSLSSGNENMIVGDIKQSIYRWRGGDWSLLLNGVKKDIGDMFIEEKSLDTNWRSRENIIKFNNTIFEILPEILQNQYNSKINEISDENEKQKLIDEKYNSILKDAYKGHSQEVPEKDTVKGGKVSIRFFDGKDYLEKISENLTELIENLLTEENKEPKDIGILVRTNDQAKKITEILTSHQNNNPAAVKYKIVSGEALYIENSKAVRVLVSAMKYLINKNDIINIAELVTAFQLLKNKDVNLNEIFLSLNSEKYKEFLPEKFISETENLLQKELFELSELLISYFQLYKYNKEFAYLKTFQDHIFEQSRKKYFDLHGFSDWWEEKGKKISVKISEKTNAVNILTIHKSKGLAFDTVIIPYIDFALENTGSILWTKPAGKPFDNIELIPVKYSSILNKTKLKKDYFNEMLYGYTDAVNLIYVAFTRAVNELHIFGKIYETKKNETAIKNTGKAIFDIINQKNGITFSYGNYYDKEKKLFELSDNHFNKIKEKEQEIYKEFILDNYPNNNFNDKIKIKYASEDFMIESIPEIKEKVNYGKLMHNIFQNIITAKDVQTAVMKAHSEGLITFSEAENLKRKISEIISDEKTKTWFDGTYKVLNEDAVLTEKGDIKIPDRVMISDKEIIIIDFKFGKHREEYKKQISEYQRLIKNLYNLPVKSYLFYPENMKIIPLNDD